MKNAEAAISSRRAEGVKSLRTGGLKNFRTRGGGGTFAVGEELVPHYMPWTYPGQQNAKEITL